jgi:surfeit locus 1 family protein
MKKIFAALLFITAFITLIFLGTWQLKRLEWKTAIIQKLDFEYQNSKDISFQELDPLDSNAIRYGSLSGKFLYESEILVGPKPHDNIIGYHVITPLKLNDNNHILVNRGWISIDRVSDISQTHENALMTVTGLLRVPDWNRFTPDNSPENNIWTKLDIKQIAREKNISPVSKFMLYATDINPSPSALLTLQKKDWSPRNKHQQYAIFWFTMAGVLVILFGFYMWQSRIKKSS